MTLSATERERLITLARSRRPEDRESLLHAVVGLCESAQAMTPRSRELLQDLFMELAAQAERDIRRKLAERLANADWAPHALICVLALDEIEIARPLIASSPVLEDADLVRLLVQATLEHQIEVARRPNIGATVVNAILDQHQPAVMTALAGNQTAQVTPLHMERMVAAARRFASMRGPLARHPKLGPDLAKTLYLLVGESLRATISERFAIDEHALADALAGAVHDAAHPETDDSDLLAGDETGDVDARLVDKLKAAGQLRPGFLLRTLREGRRRLFALALAELGGYPTDSVRRAIRSDRPELLAAACAGVGIDRSVFPTILELVQTLNAGQPADAPESRPRIADAFALSPADAARRFCEDVARI